MNITEIGKYLTSGSTKSVCVSRKLSDRYQGFVRDLTIHENCMVSIEYNTYGYDEGGLTILMHYASQEALIESLEKYIGANLDDWDNVSRSGFYPSSPGGDVDFDSSGKCLKQDLFNKTLDIPQNWESMDVLGDYWIGIYEGKTAFWYC